MRIAPTSGMTKARLFVGAILLLMPAGVYAGYWFVGPRRSAPYGGWLHDPWLLWIAPYLIAAVLVLVAPAKIRAALGVLLFLFGLWMLGQLFAGI